MILRGAYNVEFTGLKRVIGSPKNYDDNLNEPGAFTRKVDLRIPKNETDQGRDKMKSDSFDELSNLEDALATDPTNHLQKSMQKLEVSKQKRAKEYSRGPEAPSLDEDYVPVNCLNTYVQDWAIKVKVTKKYDLREWNNARGRGTLLNIDLMDRSRHQIQATFFKDAAQKYDAELQEGHTYVMRGGQIKLANKRFTTIPNDHCITFDIGC